MSMAEFASLRRLVRSSSLWDELTSGERMEITLEMTLSALERVAEGDSLCSEASAGKD
jgi:hypothetical protein